MPLRDSPVWLWILFLIPFSSFRFWIPFADSTFWGCLFFILNWMKIARLNWINTIKMNLVKWELNWLLNYVNSEQCYILQGRPGGGGGGRGYWKTSIPEKIRQNTPKYPKFIQIYPKLYPGILYTWNSKKVIYRIPVFNLQYTVYPILKAPVYRIPKNPGQPWFWLAMVVAKLNKKMQASPWRSSLKINSKSL